jgi:ATP-dependent Clp protease ATP-binding subunit ClpB
MFGQIDQGDGEEDDMDSRTATFPMLNQLFGSANPPANPNEKLPAKRHEPKQEENQEEESGKKKNKKSTLLNCILIPPIYLIPQKYGQKF